MTVKILTGDNHLISRKVCNDVGLSADPMLLGADVEKMSDPDLTEAAEMAPIQVLTNNLLYDFSQIPIPIDSVDEEQVVKPRPWNISEITRFILFIGPVSSIFDYTTFFLMLWVFNCWDPARAKVFQTGWFVESLMTQTLISHIIRTNKIPFIQSRASWPLTATTVSIMAFGIWLPYSPLAPWLGLTHLPQTYWPILTLTLLCYVGLTQGIKVWLLRRKWI